MSGQQREREIKMGVPDAAALERLVREAGGRRSEVVLQENHFFEDPERSLRARRLGLRIRLEAGRATLSLKRMAGGEGPALVAEGLELECPLAPEEADRFLEGRAPASGLLARLAAAARTAESREAVALLRAIDGERALRPIGSFRNRRTRVEARLPAPGGGETAALGLEFDATEFGPGAGRFEVELEIPPEADAEALSAALAALFARAGVEPVPTGAKLAAFLAWLDARGGRPP